jgi:branched-chain amino acid transport system permease protein
MAVGAFAAYNFMLRIEGMPFLVALVLAGLTAAAVGILFGLPSLRIKGFYLAVATLAAQFFIVWALVKFPWFSNNSSSGVVTAQDVTILGYTFATPEAKYVLTFLIVAFMALLAKNMVRSSTGRAWMAVRDMDVAAQVIGFRLMRTKLLAFAVSSFYCGVAGALYAYTYIGTVEPEGFNLDLSFKILFMIIIGGVGSIMGSFLGAAFIVLLPILNSTTFVPAIFGDSPGGRLRVQLPAHRVRRPDHLLPDRRAPRPGPAVADRQGEAAPVALPALKNCPAKEDFVSPFSCSTHT